MLEIYIVARTSEVVIGSGVNVILNNDSTAIYDYQDVKGAGSTAAAAELLAQTAWNLLVPGDSAQVGSASAIVLVLPGYAGTTFHKTVSGTLGFGEDTAGQNRARAVNLRYRSTSVITRLAVTAQSGNLRTGSQLLIYGR